MNASQMSEARRLDLIRRASATATTRGIRMQGLKRLGFTNHPRYETLRRQQCTALDVLAALKVASAQGN